MANITTELSNIKNAVLGKDVRSSIHDGIYAINKEVEGTTQKQSDLNDKQDALNEKFKNLIINAGNSNAEVAASRGSYDYLPDRLNAVDEQFNTIVNKVTTRIFKPRFGVSTYWGEVTNTTGGCYTATFENMKNDVEIWKAHGVDDVVVILHVGYNTLTNDLFLAEDLELIKQGCNSIIENGLNIKTVKLHVMELTKENATTMGIELFKSKYKSLINNICNKFAPLHIEYFIPFNEVDWIYNDDSYKQFVIDVVNLCKTFSYKTSISTAGHEENFNISDDITSLLDAISINYYQSISSKNNISYNDSINSWKTSPLLNFCEHFKTKYPSKHIFISETGVNDYKEALINPETSFGLDRNNGIYQSIYMFGMFNVLNSQFIDGIWWWFGFSNKDGLTSKITNYYLRGGNYEL